MSDPRESFGRGRLDARTPVALSVTNVSDLKTKECTELYTLWRDRHLGELPPQSIDPLDVPGLLSRLVVFHCTDEPGRYRVKYVGTRVVTASGVDLTGELASVSEGRAPLSCLLADAVRASTSAKMLGKIEILSEPESYFFAETLALPLVDDEGKVRSIWILHGEA